jgi:hypothetical protein
MSAALLLHPLMVPDDRLSSFDVQVPPLQEPSVTWRAPLGSLHPLDPLEPPDDDGDGDGVHVLAGEGTPPLPLLTPPLVVLDPPRWPAPGPGAPSSMSWHDAPVAAKSETATRQSALLARLRFESESETLFMRGLPRP